MGKCWPSPGIKLKRENPWVLWSPYCETELQHIMIMHDRWYSTYSHFLHHMCMP